MGLTTRKIVQLMSAWAVFLAVYTVISLTHAHNRQMLSNFADITQCFVPLLANAGLLLNAGTPHWRRNVFWMLVALSCTLWMVGQFEWTYYEVYLHKPVPDLFAGDIIFFLRNIPLIAALAMRPHLKRGEVRIGLGYMDFALLLTWWTFLYVFVVLPWMYATPTLAVYNYNYNILDYIQHIVIIAGFGWMWLRTQRAWRSVYAHLFGASALYMLTSMTVNMAIAHNRYFTGSLYDLPLLTVFFWYAYAGWVAHR